MFIPPVVTFLCIVSGIIAFSLMFMLIGYFNSYPGKDKFILGCIFFSIISLIFLLVLIYLKLEPLNYYFYHEFKPKN